MKVFNKGKVFIFVPFVISLGNMFIRSIWLIPVIIILMFFIVAIVPWCHRRENLWLFILSAFCLVPINFFLLTEYRQWIDLFGIASNGLVYDIALLEFILIATGVEELIIAVIGRKIWKRQYAFSIPGIEKED